ncbi:MAG: HEPN domain-containing protein [Gemmatimonadota bacterium]|nr:HEPN domain-containing protein [Gemmatimonadota bacterium]MDE2870442.1 HEPN domain-containing protein [Gemmatimonadota bacterium]
MTAELHADRWLDAALDDLRHARHAEEGGFRSHACFSSQQAAEKAVKAVHYARGARAVLGHSVRNLIERLDPRIPELDELLDDARELDLYQHPHTVSQWIGGVDPGGGFRGAAGGEGDCRGVGDRDGGAAGRSGWLTGVRDLLACVLRM